MRATFYPLFWPCRRVWQPPRCSKVLHEQCQQSFRKGYSSAICYQNMRKTWLSGEIEADQQDVIKTIRQLMVILIELRTHSMIDIQVAVNFYQLRGLCHSGGKDLNWGGLDPPETYLSDTSTVCFSCSCMNWEADEKTNNAGDCFPTAVDLHRTLWRSRQMQGFLAYEILPVPLRLQGFLATTAFPGSSALWDLKLGMICGCLVLWSFDVDSWCLPIALPR